MSKFHDSSNEQVLLVEGRNDLHVIHHIFCRRTGTEPIFATKVKEDVQRLLKSIPVEVKAPGLVQLGIIVDANDDLNARWQAVRNKLLSAGIPCPPEPESAGTIIDGFPRIGIWLMPNNKSTGELEDLIQGMIPDGDPVWPLSEAYIDGIPKPQRMFRPGKITRAKVHAWLATRSDPRPMGTAIKATDLIVDTEECVDLVDWLRRLFQ